MDSALFILGSVIIMVVFPWLVAFISGRQAFDALQLGVASWPRPRTTSYFGRREEPIRYWLVVVVQLSLAVFFAVTPILYYWTVYATRR